MTVLPCPNPMAARAVSKGESQPLTPRLSDLWRAPLTDLPIRDELIRQYVPLSTEMEILEAGPGSGFLAFLISRTVRALTLLEVATEPAGELRRRFANQPNVDVVNEDLCNQRLGQGLEARYDAVISIEVFEFLADPATALHNMAVMLRPGGQLYLQFPNYENSDWPTFYRTRQELDAHLGGAGFISWEIYSLQLSRWSQWIFDSLHEVPLRCYRARQLARQKRPSAPKRYDETWAFHHARSFELLKVPIHLYWAAIMLLMKSGGDVFRRVECGEEIFSKNLFVVASAAEGELSHYDKLECSSNE